MSAHLPPDKDQHIFERCVAELSRCLTDIKKALGKTKIIMGVDADCEIPVLDDLGLRIAGELATGTVNERSMVFPELSSTHRLLAANTFPFGAHVDAQNSWTFTGTRGQHRLIDYICCDGTCPYTVNYTTCNNTDHNAIAFDVPLGEICRGELPFAYRKSRRLNYKGWRPLDFQHGVRFGAMIEVTTQGCKDLAQFQTCVMQAARTTRGSNTYQRTTIRIPKPASLIDARVVLSSSTCAASKRDASRRVMRELRKYNDSCDALRRDRDSCWGARVTGPKNACSFDS